MIVYTILFYRYKQLFEVNVLHRCILLDPYWYPELPLSS
jgi:hypothetical protein